MRSIAAHQVSRGVVVAMLALAGCGASGDAGPGDDGGRDPASCEVLWTAQDTQYGARVVRLTVEGGDLVIRALQAATGPLTAITQRGIVGDFDAELSFHDFDSYGPGNYVRLQVEADGADPLVLDGLRHSVVVGSAYANDLTNVTLRVDDERSAISASPGALRISRRGATLTLEGEVGSAKLSRQQSFVAEPVQLSIGVGIEGGMPWIDQRMSVRISEFHLQGGGSRASSDSFDCERTVRLPAP